MRRSTINAGNKYTANHYGYTGIVYNIDDGGMHEIMVINREADMVLSVFIGKDICEVFVNEFDKRYVYGGGKDLKKEEVDLVKPEGLSEAFILKVVGMVVNREKFNDLK